MSESYIPNVNTSYSKLSHFTNVHAHSPWPIWSLSALFIGTSPLGIANRATPPFALRFTFGLIFAGAGYVLSTGDVENGCGIATSWTGSYFLVNGIRKEFNKLRGPQNSSPTYRFPLWKKLALPLYPAYWSGRPALRLPPPLVLTLNSATALTMLLYGFEYFVFWGSREKTKRP